MIRHQHLRIALHVRASPHFEFSHDGDGRSIEMLETAEAAGEAVNGSSIASDSATADERERLTDDVLTDEIAEKR